jgi:hypothetical protein
MYLSFISLRSICSGCYMPFDSFMHSGFRSSIWDFLLRVNCFNFSGIRTSLLLRSSGGRSPRALSRRHTLGRSRFRGRCASRRHSPRHADVSVSWRDRPDRYRPESSSEASSPSSDAPCRERRAGRGADTPAILVLSRRHRYHGDGASFWLAVGPALRV